MWVITRAINEYDQDGEYLQTVYFSKPTLETLIDFCGNKEDAEHLLKGGGRKNTEDVWFYLVELEEGEIYQHKNI